MPPIRSTLLLSLVPVVALAAYEELTWDSLMPAEEQEAFAEQSQVDHQSPAGYAGDISAFSGTVAELDGREVRLPGFIVPLELRENNSLLEFFLVPYFGACIHVPPPPPNQIVYGKLDQPVESKQIWQPYWVYGTLKVETIENEVASSSYVMEVDRIEPYE